jgi:hypothetical protein
MVADGPCAAGYPCRTLSNVFDRAAGKGLARRTGVAFAGPALSTESAGGQALGYMAG